VGVAHAVSLQDGRSGAAVGTEGSAVRVGATARANPSARRPGGAFTQWTAATGDPSAQAPPVPGTL